MQTKAWRWLFPGRHILIFGGTHSGNTRGKIWDLTRPCPSDLCCMTLSRVGFLTLAPGIPENVLLRMMSFKPPETTCWRNLAEGIWHTEIQDPLSQGTNGNQSLTRWISFCVFFLLTLVVSWVLSKRQRLANFFFFYFNSALSPLSLLTFSQGLMQLTLYF